MIGKIILAGFVIVGILVLIPVAEIWALNTLFPMLAIPLTIDTWMAMVIITGAISGSTGLNFRSKK